MLLGQLAVVFVGIAGNHHEAVEHQLAPTLAKAGVTELAVSDGDLGAIVRNTRASKQVVRKLHVDGVIAGALVPAGNNAWSFRVVIYDGDGKLTSEGETPLAHRALAKVDLEVFEMNLIDAMSSFHHGATTPAKKQAAPPAHVAAPVDTSAHDDDDAPVGLTGAAKPARPPARARDVEHAPTPVETAHVDDDTAAAEPAVHATAPTAPAAAHATRIDVGLTFGIVSRSFSPDANTVKDYSSTPVGTAGVELAVEPIARLRLAGGYERTIVMNSVVAGANAATTISHWQLAGEYALVRGPIAIAPEVGIGARGFAIASASMSRSPDNTYTYAIVGATLRVPLGKRLALRGAVAYEPELGGTKPMVFDDAVRWGLDLGAALEVQAATHVFARAAFDYQRFAWQGTGGAATDVYPSGSIAAGATF